MDLPPFPIVDLHCDLLSYLTHKPGRTFLDAASRVSASQLAAGNVKVQTLAIYTPEHQKSAELGAAQVEKFCQIAQLPSLPRFLPAFENASSFCNPEEPLIEGLKRLDHYHALLGKIFYISLTWNGENRFGGGTDAPGGLKRDGKILLEWMAGKQVAVDLSHASDPLSYEIIEFIDQQALEIPIIASHSNFRAVQNTREISPMISLKRSSGAMGSSASIYSPHSSIKLTPLPSFATSNMA